MSGDPKTSGPTRSILITLFTILCGAGLAALYQNCAPMEATDLSSGENPFGLNVSIENVDLQNFDPSETYPKVEVSVANRGPELESDLSLEVLAFVDGNEPSLLHYDVPAHILNSGEGRAVVIVDCMDTTLSCTYQKNSSLSLNLSLSGKVKGQSRSIDQATFKFDLKTGKKVPDPGGGNPQDPTDPRPTPDTPEAPAKPSAASTATTITVNWITPSDGGSAITGYDIERTGGGLRGEVKTFEAAASASTMSFTSSGADPVVAATSYTFRVRAKNANGAGGYSVMSDAISLNIPGATVPEPVAMPSVTATTTAINSSWTAPSNGGSAITGYEVQVRSSLLIVPSYSQYEVGLLTSFSVPNPSTLRSYAVRVRAKNAVGWGDYGPFSDQINLKPVPASAPGVVAKPTVSSNTSSVSVSWQAPSTGGSPITGYVINMSTNGNYSRIFNAEASARSFTVTTDLNSSAVYRFRVRAQNSVGVGAQSPESDSIGLQTPVVTPECNSGDRQTEAVSCSVSGNTAYEISRTRVCTNGQWGAWSNTESQVPCNSNFEARCNASAMVGTCVPKAVCNPGDSESSLVRCEKGTATEVTEVYRERSCKGDQTWGPYTEINIPVVCLKSGERAECNGKNGRCVAVAPPPECEPNNVETEALSCSIDGRSYEETYRTRRCSADGKWLAWTNGSGSATCVGTKIPQCTNKVGRCVESGLVP